VKKKIRSQKLTKRLETSHHTYRVFKFVQLATKSGIFPEKLLSDAHLNDNDTRISHLNIQPP